MPSIMIPLKSTRTWLVLAVALHILATGGCVGLANLDHQLNDVAAHSPTLPGGVAPPVLHHEPMTLPRFLGLDVVARRCHLAKSLVHEHVGHYIPVLHPTPLPVPLSHPSNASNSSPAIAAAHQVQQAKAASVAKVAAVKVLAGESCHDNPHVEAGLIAALDDTSPEVRIAAIEAILRSTRSCQDACGKCCSPAILQKLSDIAYTQKDADCFVEPSSKARRVARLAIDACVDHCGCGVPSCDDGHPVLEASMFPEESPSPEMIEEILGTIPMPAWSVKIKD